MTPLPCPHCGAKPLVGLSNTRQSLRAATKLLVEEARKLKGKTPNHRKAMDLMKQAIVTDDPNEKMKLLFEAERENLKTRKGREEVEAKLKALKDDVWEVRCLNCHNNGNIHCFVWETTEEATITQWNRAVEKLDPSCESQRTPKQCCRTSTKFTVDHDGEIIVRCKPCGYRWMPLAPYSPPRKEEPAPDVPTSV